VLLMPIIITILDNIWFSFIVDSVIKIECVVDKVIQRRLKVSCIHNVLDMTVVDERHVCITGFGRIDLK